MALIKIKISKLDNQKDLLRINKSGIHIRMATFLGKEGDYFVSVAPSINVSGYGKTKKEAQKSFDENLNLFCEDLFGLSIKDRDKELRKLGFKKERFQQKNFSKMYVDSEGLLQNMEEGTIESNILETTTSH